MAFEGVFAGKDYTVCINSLANLADRFLEASRQFNLRFVTAPEVPRLTKAIHLVQTAELPQVKNLAPLLEELDHELDTLVKKFQIVQRSHQRDPSLTNLIGNFSQDSEDAFKKLSDFTDDSIKLTNSVITAYAQIERDKKPAQTWISTILGPNAETTKATVKKAQHAQKIIAEVNAVTKNIRDMSQETKSELDKIKSVATRNLIRCGRAAPQSGFATAAQDAAKSFYNQ